uniref:Ig-like domain-containing protein n=1 Tax=Latimeria chalumnae TaxID=7897 RepID=H2ZTV2_LATCH
YRNGQYLAYKYAATGECCCNFTLSAIEDGDHGNYFCQYSISLQGRWKYSPLSTSVEIKVTGKCVYYSLPDPSLSLSPAYPAFVNGEETQITCLASHLGARCELYGNGQSLYYKEAAAREYNCNFTLTIKGDGDQGNYSCLYSIYSHGRWISSSYSISVEIKVTESLPAPNTSIIPEQSVFVKGEEANITCSASRSGATFYFYRDGQNLYARNVTAKENSYTFRVPVKGDGGLERYSCKYSIVIQGKKTISTLSASTDVKVIDPLLQATINLSPAYLEFVKGEEANITCGSPHSADGFQLNRNNHYLDYKYTSAGETNHTFALTLMEDEEQGNYSCRYDSDEQGRWLNSPLSGNVQIKLSGKYRGFGRQVSLVSKTASLVTGLL